MISLLNDWGAAWADWFLPALVQNTIFLGLVFLALRLLRNAPAGIKAAVATIGLVKLLLPPFLPVAPPAGEVQVGADGAVSTLLFPFAESGEALTGSAWTGGLNLSAALMCAWASIALARLGWSALQTCQLWLAVRGSRPLEPSPLPADARPRGVVVRRGERVAMAFSLGPWPRSIYVPPAWDGWTPAERAAVLAHELAHIRRRDGLVQVLEILAQAVWFPLPLVAMLIGRLHVWREVACDDAAVAGAPDARLAYSRFLARLAESGLETPALRGSAATLHRGRRELLHRVTHQLEDKLMKPVAKSRIVVVTALLVAMVVPLSLVLADPPAPPPPPKAPKAVAPAKPAAAAEPAPEAAPEPVREREVVAPERVVPLADGTAAVAPVPPPPRPRVTVMMADGALRVGSHEVTPDEFRSELEAAAAAKGPRPVVVIDGDGSVTMGRLHAVQADLLALGLTDVLYTGTVGGGLPLVLPPDKARKQLADLPPHLVTHVKVDAKGRVTVDGRAVAGADLQGVVEDLLTEQPFRVMVLDTESRTSYGAFVQVLGELKRGGAERIAVSDPAD